jgi:hypothetical protein
MKNLKSLNLGKSLNRSEMKSVAAGTAMYTCTCGTKPPVAVHGGCGCAKFCAGETC